MPDLPGGVVTFLLTDIEGSTRLWEQRPEAMREALRTHDALAAEITDCHEGVLVKSRGEGDSLFTVFARPTDALACACALQQRFASAWAEGRAMTLDQAVAFALEEGNTRRSPQSEVVCEK